MHNHGRSWSREDENALIALFALGFTLRELSTIVGRTLNALCGRLDRLGVVSVDKHGYVFNGKILIATAKERTQSSARQNK
jgi:hypothetical protein